MLRARGGFTLMEVLIAIALLLVLSGVMFAFLRDVLDSRQRVSEFSAKQRLASTIIDRIEQQTFFSLVGDSRFGSGISGDETSLTILSRGVAVGEAAHAEAWHKAFIDLICTEYRFDEPSHTVHVRQSVPIMTADKNADENADDNAARARGEGRHADEEARESFETRLYKLRFRYYDGVRWQSSYDSLEAGRLPRAIEVAIWFDPWPGSDWNEEEPAFPDAFGEPVEPERLTFDMEGVFDEFEHATRADRDFRPDPPPDRIRVIAILDADEDAFDAPIDEEAG